MLARDGGVGRAVQVVCDMHCGRLASMYLMRAEGSLSNVAHTGIVAGRGTPWLDCRMGGLVIYRSAAFYAEPRYAAEKCAAWKERRRAEGEGKYALI